MKILKIIFFVIIGILALIGLKSLILFIMGYRPIRTISVYLDWSASGSIASWISGIAIPFTIWFLNNRMKKRDDKMLKELNDFKNEYEQKLKALATLVNPDDTLKDVPTKAMSDEDILKLFDKN